jgi:hypothetical protein
MERAARIAARLSDRRPDEWIYAASRVEALIKLAGVLSRGGRSPEALVHSAQAIRTATELAANYEDCGVFRLWVGHALRRRGDLLRSQNDPQAALQQYGLAVDAFADLLAGEQSELELAAVKNLQRVSAARSAVLAGLNRNAQSEAAKLQSHRYRKRFRMLVDSEQ